MGWEDHTKDLLLVVAHVILVTVSVRILDLDFDFCGLGLRLYNLQATFVSVEVDRFINSIAMSL